MNFPFEIKGGEFSDKLYPHQQEALEDVLSTIENGERSGFVEMATGSGKTAIMSALTEMFLNTNPNSRALIIAPSLQICQQIQSELFKHNQSIQEEDISFLTEGREVNESSKIIIASYSSFNTRNEELGNIGMVLADECHRSLGPVTRKNMLQFQPSAYKIGFSATPSFRLNRQSEELFGSPMHRLSLRDAIKSGVAQPVDAFVYTTNAEIQIKKGGIGDLTQEELEPLINNTARNKAAIALASELIKEERQGIINCIPGNSNSHARALAEMLSRKKIIDGQGIERKIVAKAVGNHLKKEDQEIILKEYEAGQVDVLTFTKALEEGWDSAAASFAINLTPTTSELKIKQLLGRILRKKSDDQRPSIYIDLIDKQTNRFKALYTGMHALDFQRADGTGRDLLTSFNSSSIRPNSSVPQASDKSYLSAMLSHYLLENIITSEDELEHYMRANKSAETSDKLAARQLRELTDIISPKFDPSHYKRNMHLLRNPPRLFNMSNADILSLEELGKYANELDFFNEDTDDDILERTVGAGDGIDESLNRIAELTEGSSRLPRHMAATLLKNSSYFQTDSYSSLGSDMPSSVSQQAPSPEKYAEQILLQEKLESVLDTLNEREAGVIRMYYGLNGERWTLQEIGKVYGITTERVRQIESKTMSKLRHPLRSGVLRDFVKPDYNEFALPRQAESSKLLQKNQKEILKESGILERKLEKNEITTTAFNWASQLLSTLDNKQTGIEPSYALEILFDSWDAKFQALLMREIANSIKDKGKVDRKFIIANIAQYLEPDIYTQFTKNINKIEKDSISVTYEVLSKEENIFISNQRLAISLGIKPNHFNFLISTLHDKYLIEFEKQQIYSSNQVNALVKVLLNENIISPKKEGGYEPNLEKLYANLLSRSAIQGMRNYISIASHIKKLDDHQPESR